MFRLGIVSKNSIPIDIDQPERLPPIALTLLSEFTGDLSDIDEARLASIYATLKGYPNSRMITFPRRFEKVDEAIEVELETMRKSANSIRIHEMAASNAITSLDLFERLKHWGNVSVKATDYSDAIYVKSAPGSRWRVVYDADMMPVQFVGTPWVIWVDKERKRYPINRLIRKFLIGSLLPRVAGASVDRIVLFHPRCVATARSDSRFRLGRENAFKPEPVPCDVLRVMNFSNLIARGQEQSILAGMCAHLTDGGLLVLGDAPRSQANLGATIFQRRGSRFAFLRDIARGYERKQAVLDLRLDAA